jgi:hypothetical protein
MYKNIFLEEKIDLGYKYKIPIIYKIPAKINTNSKIFIFNGGLHSTNAQIKIIDNKLFDTNYLVSFERLGTGNNLNKAKR